jgi:hypothetical protein
MWLATDLQLALSADGTRPTAVARQWQLRLILARESPALRLVHVHFPKAGFELSEP